MERDPARRVAARRRRHHARARRQFHRGPLRSHLRCPRQSSEHVGSRSELDALRRCGPVQRSQRSRLRGGGRQVFLLSAPAAAGSREGAPQEGYAMLKKVLSSVGTLLVMAGLSASALAAITAQEAARLGADLTPLGGEKAGNAAGTIPAWNGGLKSAADAGVQSFTPGTAHPDPFASEKPLF